MLLTRSAKTTRLTVPGARSKTARVDRAMPSSPPFLPYAKSNFSSGSTL